MTEERARTSSHSRIHNGTVHDPVRSLILAPAYPPAFRAGGPIQTLHGLVTEAPEGHEVSVLTPNRDLGDTQPLVDEPDTFILKDGANVWYSSRGVLPYLRALTASRRLRPHVVYLNSFFNVRFSIVPQLLHRAGFWKNSLLLIAPRGELYARALAIKPMKKRLYLRLYKAMATPRKSTWHASNTTEAAYIRDAFGNGINIIIRENESPLPRSAASQTPRSEAACRIKFISRAVPNKGLHTLLEALARVTCPVHLEIVGAFENDAYQRRCKGLADKLPDHVGFSFTGPLRRAHVLERLNKADCLVLPTDTENFGQIVAEALSQSCPVLCSANTPWTRVLETGGGVVVEPNDVSTWRRILQGYSSLGPDEWLRLSRRAGDAYNAWRSLSKPPHVLATAAMLKAGIPRDLRIQQEGNASE